LELDYGASVVASKEVVAADANLENSLVKNSRWPWFGVPQILKRLVTLEILTSVELLDAMDQLWWRRLVTAFSWITCRNAP
jgi:hypothetical protein